MSQFRSITYSQQVQPTVSELGVPCVNEDPNYGDERAWVKFAASFLECVYGVYSSLHYVRGHLLVSLPEARQSSFHLLDDALRKSTQV